MRRLLPLLAVVAAVLAACPQFSEDGRYACESPDDCLEGEACSNGACGADGNGGTGGGGSGGAGCEACRTCPAGSVFFGPEDTYEGQNLYELCTLGGREVRRCDVEGCEGGCCRTDGS